jgi:hypothetical protein
MTRDGPPIQLRLANLAVKAPLDETVDWLERTPGAELITRHDLGGASFIEALVGNTTVNVFESAIYERPDSPLPPGLLHISYWVEDLEEALADRSWADALIWGPEQISGGFGRRRIAFFEPLPGQRIELMEDLGE